jgi:hypothetical protein
MSTTNEVISSNSNSILENSRIIHIAAEVVVVSGLAAYVVYENRKLSTSVQELTVKLEERDEMCAKLEGSIEQLKIVMSQMNQKIQQHENGLNILSDRISSISEASSSETYKKSKSAVKVKAAPEKVKEVKHVKPLFKETPPVSRVSKIQFKKPVVESDSDDDKIVSKSSKSIEELSDSDLDDEISQELAELEEVDSSLKKE